MIKEQIELAASVLQGGGQVWISSFEVIRINSFYDHNCILMASPKEVYIAHTAELGDIIMNGIDEEYVTYNAKRKHG